MYPRQIYENNDYVDDFGDVRHNLKLYNNKYMKAKNKTNYYNIHNDYSASSKCYYNNNNKYDNLNMINVRKNYGFKYKNLNVYQKKISDSGNKDERRYLKSFNSQNKNNNNNKDNSNNNNDNRNGSNRNEDNGSNGNNNKNNSGNNNNNNNNNYKKNNNNNKKNNN